MAYHRFILQCQKEARDCLRLINAVAHGFIYISLSHLLLKKIINIQKYLYPKTTLFLIFFKIPILSFLIFTFFFFGIVPVQVLLNITLVFFFGTEFLLCSVSFVLSQSFPLFVCFLKKKKNFTNFKINIIAAKSNNFFFPHSLISCRDVDWRNLRMTIWCAQIRGVMFLSQNYLTSIMLVRCMI